jgi:ankyrin repeat protein
MTKMRILKIVALSFLSLIAGYLIFMAYVVMTTDKCSILDAAVSSKNKQASAFWKFYLGNLNSFSIDHVCFPGDVNKRPLTILVATCASVKNYPVCKDLATQILEQGADINANDPDQEFGFTALHDAVFGVDINMVDLLLSRGVDLSRKSTGTKFFNKTPLELISTLRQVKSEEMETINRIENMLIEKSRQNGRESK